MACFFITIAKKPKQTAINISSLLLFVVVNRKNTFRLTIMKNSVFKYILMKNRVDIERKFWDSFARKYDKDRKKSANNETYEEMFKMFLEDVDGTEDLLEVATGTGLISLQIRNFVPSITAIDLSPEMLKIAQEKAEKQSVNNIDFRIGDICQLEFLDNSFDTVIASNVLHLLFEPDVAMQEIKRVLKPNGKIIVPTYCHGENFKSHFFSRCMNLMGFRARSRWSFNSFQKFVEKNGFSITKTKIINGVIPLCYLVASQRSKDNS